MRMILMVTAALGAALTLAPSARAHPCFVGVWTGPLPCPGTDAYEFGPGEFIGGGVWTGCLRKTTNGQLISTGWYELRMWSGTEGTVSIREGQCISTAVGTVDLSSRTMDYLGTAYRH
ncbi:MAG: hypothetical protein ACRC33_09120 [Gemmataceae bacterium]